MNPGQEKFYDFIVARVGEKHLEEAKALMRENFKKQDDGTFSPEFMRETQAKLTAMLKPETVDEVKTAMAHFASQIKI